MVPAPSAFSLAAARLCWALPETALVSLHGRELSRLRPHLHHGARVLALTSDSEGPAALARLLTDTGFGASYLTVLEALGGANERVRSATAETFGLSNVAPLNTVAIEVEAGAGARVIAFGAGLDDDLFEHDGQITKREIRAVTLSSLAPQARSVAVGHRRGRGLGRHRVDAGSPFAAGHRRSRPDPTAPRASAAMPQRLACPGSMWSRVMRQKLWPPPRPATGDLHRRRRKRTGRARRRSASAPSWRPARRQRRDARDRGRADRASTPSCAAS